MQRSRSWAGLLDRAVAAAAEALVDQVIDIKSSSAVLQVYEACLKQRNAGIVLDDHATEEQISSGILHPT
jgi:hypothetical protein